MPSFGPCFLFPILSQRQLDNSLHGDLHLQLITSQLFLPKSGACNFSVVSPNLGSWSYFLQFNPFRSLLFNTTTRACNSLNQHLHIAFFPSMGPHSPQAWATSFTTFCFVGPHSVQVRGHLVYNIHWLTWHLLVNVGPPPLQRSLIYMALASQFTSFHAFWKICFIKHLLFTFFILWNI